MGNSLSGAKEENEIASSESTKTIATSCVLHNPSMSDTTTVDGHNLKNSPHEFPFLPNHNDLKKEETLVKRVDYDPVDILRCEFGFEYRRVTCCCLDCCCAVDDGSCSNNIHQQCRKENNDGDDKATKSTRMDLTRLVHIESNTLISSKNRLDFIPDGPMFDKISHLCQEIAQDQIQKQYSLKYVNIKESGSCRGKKDDKGKVEQPPIRALVDQDLYRVDDDDENQTQHILIIITGKGKSRAGILSIKELIHSGYEYGSATMHLMEAKKRQMKVILLDPNARGISNGMDTVYRSLNYLLFRRNDYNNKSTTTSDMQKPIYYILAHSAAGGYLTRYFLLLLDGGSPGGCCDEHYPIQPQQVQEFLDNNLGAIAFSDSTHNIQWTKQHPKLFEFLQSSKCLFIRNNTIHSSEFCSDDTKHKPGELVDDTDYWWKRRFGSIKTVWAGTIHHGLVCTVPCHVIWDFFDETQQTE